MSSILKALKKLEAEKTLHQEASAINLSREILRKQPGGRNMTLWLGLTVLVALVVIAALTVLLLSKPARSPESATAPPAPITAPAAATPLTIPGAPPAAPADTPRTGRAPGPHTAERRPLSDNPAAPLPMLPAAAGSSKAAPADSPPPAASALPVDTVKRALPRQAEPATPSLILSGIAWNKDSADRLAIINGQPTATGATVSGVVVEEILPDRVRVNNAGRAFEIFLGGPAKTN